MILSENALISLFLSACVYLPTEIASSHITGEFRYFQTAKGC
jgi:hypothetical protein